MAATVSILGTATWNTTAGSKTVTATPAVGDLIVLVVAHSGNTASVAPTDNNSGGAGTYTLINTAVKATSADTMQIWVRTALITSATSTVFTHNPGTTTGGGIVAIDVQGMSKTGASAVVRSAIQSNIASGTPAPVLGATPSSINAIIGAVFNASNPATMTPRANYTEIADLGYNTPASGLEVMVRNSGETSATITWGSTSGSAFCSIAIELDTTTAHATSGTPTGQGSTLSATAARTHVFDTSGAPTGQGSALAGTSSRFRTYNTSGALTGPGAVVVGAAPHNPVTHSTSGALPGQTAVLSAPGSGAGINASQPYITLGQYADTNSGSKSVTGIPPVGSLPILITFHTNNSDLSTAPTDNNAGGSGSYVMVLQLQPQNVNDGNAQMQMCVWVRTARITSATSTTFTHNPSGSASTTGGGILALALTSGTLAGWNAVGNGAYGYTSNNVSNPNISLFAASKQDLVFAILVNASTTPLSGPTATGYTWSYPGPLTVTTPDSGVFIAASTTLAVGDYVNAAWSGTVTGQAGVASIAFKVPVAHSTSGTLTGQGSTLSAARAGRNLSQPIVYLGSANTTTDGSGTFSIVLTPPVGSLPILYVAYSGSDGSGSLSDNNAGGGGSYNALAYSNKYSVADAVQGFVRNARITSATSTTFTFTPPTSVTGVAIVALALTEGTRVAGNSINGNYSGSSSYSGGSTNPISLVVADRNSDLVLVAVFSGESASPFSAPTSSGFSFKLGGASTYAVPDNTLSVYYSEFVAPTGGSFVQITHPGTSAAPGAITYLKLTAQDTHDTSGTLTGPGASVVGAATIPVVHATSGALPGQTATLSAGRAGRNISQPIVFLGSAADTNDGAKSVTVTVAAGSLPVVFIGHTATTNDLTAYNTAPTDSLGGTYVRVGGSTKPGTYLMPWTRTARIGSTQSITFTHTPPYTTGGGAIFVMALTEGTLAGSDAASSGVSVWWDSATNNPYQQVVSAKNYTDVVLQYYWSDETQVFSGPTTSGFSYKPLASASFSTPTSQIVFTYSEYVAPSDTTTSIATWGGYTTAPIALGASTFRTTNPRYTSGALTGQGSTVTGFAPHNPVTHSTSGTLAGTSSAISVVKAGVNVSMPVVTLGTYADTNSGAKSVTATPAVGALPIIITYHAANADYTTLPTDDNGGGGTYVLVDRTSHFNYIDGQNGQLNVWVRTTRISAAVSTTFTHNPGTTSGGGLNVMALMGGSLSGLSAITYHYAAAGGANVVNPYILLKTLNRSDVSIELLGHVSTSAPAIALSITGYTWLAGPTMSYSGPDYSHTIAISDTVAGAGEVYSQRWFVNTSGYYSYATLTLRETNKHDATGSLTGPGSAIVGAATKPVVHGTSGALTGQGSTLSAGRAGRNISQPIVYLGSTADTNTGAKSVTVTVPAGALPVVVIAHTTASWENISPTDSLGGTYYYTNDGSTPNTYWIAFTRTSRVATATSITFTQTPTLNTTGGAIFVFALTEGTLAGSSAVRVSNSVWYSSGTVNPNMAWTRSRNYSDVVLQFYVSESGDTFTGPTASGYSFLPAVSASFNTPSTSFGFVYSDYVSPSDTDVITSSLWGGTSTGPVTLGSITFRTLNPHYTTGALAGPGSTVAGTASLTVKVTHATSGALTGQGSTVAGTSTRFHAFSTTGALIGQSPVVAGSATRFHAFATSGALTGQIGSVAGTSVHNAPHATSGVLTGQIGSVAGTANRFHAFATSGVLTGQIGSVAGTSVHNVPHATSGVLTGPGTAVVGTSTRFHAFATSGVLTGQTGSVAGTADHKYLHATSGVLAGQGAAVVGSSTRFHAFATSGVLTGQLGSVAGAAARTHVFATSGILTGQLGSVAGTSARTHVFATSGALTGQGSAVAGTSARTHVFATSGALTGQSTTVAGTSVRTSAHSTSGALAGQGAVLSAARAGRNLSQPIVYIGSASTTADGTTPVGFSFTFPAGSLPIIMVGLSGSATAPTIADDGLAGGADSTYRSSTLASWPAQLIGNHAFLRRSRVTSAVSTTVTITPPTGCTGFAVVALALTEGTLNGNNIYYNAAGGSNSAGSVNPSQALPIAYRPSDVFIAAMYQASSTDPYSDFTASGFLFNLVGSSTYTTPDSGLFVRTSTYVNPTGSATTSQYVGTANSTFAAGALMIRAQDLHATTAATLTGPGSAVAGTSARFRTYATSGALTGQIGAVAGTSVHSVPHATSGALTGQIGSVAGTSARTRVHDTSGALPGQTATLSATAERIAGAYARPSSGALVAQGSTVSGSASRVHVFTTSGALTGQSSTVAGSANRVHIFTTSGTLSGQGAVVVSSANRTHVFSTSGALAGQAASVAGTARRFRTLSTSGVLAGQSSVLAGTSARFHAFSATGTLTGQGAALAGVSSRTHVFTAVAALIGQGSVVAGTARREVDFNASGSLFGQGSAVSGSAVRVVLHSTAGSLTAQGSVIVGVSANNTTHAVSGSLTGPGAEAVGAALRAGAPGSNTAGARGFMVFF